MFSGSIQKFIINSYFPKVSAVLDQNVIACQHEYKLQSNILFYKMFSGSIQKFIINSYFPKVSAVLDQNVISHLTFSGTE